MKQVNISLTPAQCRAARGLLQLSQAELASLAQVSVRTILDFEMGRREPIKVTLASIQRALEEAGVEFLDGDGVQRRKGKRAKR